MRLFGRSSLALVSDAALAGEACDLRDKVVAHLGQKYGEVVISRGISTAGARTS